MPNNRVHVATVSNHHFLLTLPQDICCARCMLPAPLDSGLTLIQKCPLGAGLQVCVSTTVAASVYQLDQRVTNCLTGGEPRATRDFLEDKAPIPGKRRNF